MNNENYKTEVEEHRKQIPVEEEFDQKPLPSRVELHSKNKKPKQKTQSKHILINSILGLFTLIPVVILIYVISDFYKPDDTTAAQEDTGFRFEVGDPAAGTDSEKTPDSKEDASIAAEEGNKEEKIQPNSNSAEQTKEPQKKPQPIPAEQPVKKPEQKPAEKPAKQPEAKPKPVEKPKEPAKPSGRTHTVASSETLYRISVNYYGAGSDANIDKIRKANGLSSNEIHVGQTLIIP